jgi:hypothetical protein
MSDNTVERSAIREFNYSGLVSSWCHDADAFFRFCGGYSNWFDEVSVV